MDYVKETGQYLGEHSMSLRTKAGRGSWTDWIDINDQWHLVPDAPLVVNPPSVKTRGLDNPGGDGILDLTEVITGFPLYGQRSGSWDFKLLNGWDKWTAVHEDVLNTIHGKNVQVILKDDPNWYYNGRLTINEWKSDSGRNTLTLDYNFDPYKLSLATSISDDWLWDPFSFVDGVITSAVCSNISVGSSKTVNLTRKEIGRRPVTPIFHIISGTCTRIRVYNPELNGSAYIDHTDINSADLHWMDTIISCINPSNVCRVQFWGTDLVVSIDFRAGKL